jgi:hypothetical protein
MAETFSEGTNRVWYRAANFNSEDGITVRFHKPDETDDGPMSMPQCCEDGLYCLEYNFDQLGAWIGIFFEDGLKTSSSIFNIVPKTDPSVPYDGEYMKCETCVHFEMVRGKDYGICDLATGRNPYRWPYDTCPSYQDKGTG